VAISGGLGALGLLAAAWLAWQGAQHIMLLGRSGRCDCLLCKSDGT
jgi:ketopantoate reductase